MNVLQYIYKQNKFTNNQIKEIRKELVKNHYDKYYQIIKSQDLRSAEGRNTRTRGNSHVNYIFGNVYDELLNELESELLNEAFQNIPQRQFL